MVTIRRLYIYLVCLFSLQAVVFAINALVGGFIGLITNNNAEGLEFFTFQMAIIIVGGPVFLGHWLWGLYLVRKDATERSSLVRRLYLYTTIALFMAYLTVAQFNGLRTFFTLFISDTTGFAPTIAARVGIIINSAVTVVVTGILWLYHQRTANSDEKAAPASDGGTIQTLYALLFSGLGITLFVIGLAGRQMWLFRQLSRQEAWPLPVLLGLTIASAPLWVYHQWALRRNPHAKEKANAVLHWLYALTFNGAGVVLVFGGLAGALNWFFTRLSGKTSEVLPDALALLVAGLPVLVYHEWIVKREMQASLKPLRWTYALLFSVTSLFTAISGAVPTMSWLFSVIGGRPSEFLPYAPALLLASLPVLVYHEWQAHRTMPEGLKLLHWLYAILLSSAGVIMAVIGLMGIQQWLMERLSNHQSTSLPDMLAVLVTSLPVLIYYEGLVYWKMQDSAKLLRWLYALAASFVGVGLTLFGLVQTLRWLFSLIGGSRSGPDFGAAGLIAGLALWGYYQWVMSKNGDGVPLLRRLYIYGYSSLSVSLTVLGFIGLQQWLFARFTGNDIFKLPDALAWLITGLPIWLHFWMWAEDLFKRGSVAEQESDLRKAYLYSIIYIAVNGLVITLALLINGALRALLGLPTQGDLGLPIGIIVAMAALWAVHALVLHRDIKQAGETGLQGMMERLYWYIIAGVGLLAFVVGAAGDISVIIRTLANGFNFSTELREQLAAFTAAWVAGLPVWLIVWWPAQRAANDPGPRGVDNRRSILRKAYLYFYLFVAAMTVLVNAIAVVFQLLNALFAVFTGGNVLADLGQALGYTVIAIVVWTYHAWVLRGDGQRAKFDKEAEQQNAEAKRQQAEASWANFRVAVVDVGSGKFGKSVLAALKRQLPALNLTPIGLTHEAALAMGMDSVVDLPAQLAAAHLIVTPWTAAVPGGVVAECSVPKLVVPLAAPGIEWIGVAPQAADPALIASAVRRKLRPG